MPVSMLNIVKHWLQYLQNYTLYCSSFYNGLLHISDICYIQDIAKQVHTRLIKSVTAS